MFCIRWPAKSMRGLILVAWNGVCFFFNLGTDRGHGEMARTTRQDRMVLDALWSDPTESDEVLGVHVRNSVSEVLGIQDVVSQCQSGVSSWEEYMPFWTWQSEGGKRFEEKKVQYSKCVPVCTVSGLILVAPASCRNSTRETLWNSSSVLTNVPDAQMWPAYWGWSLATPPGPFSQKLFRRKHPVKILLTRVGDWMILEIQRFTPDSVQKILKYALRVEVQHGYEYFAAGQLLTVFSVRIPAMQIWWTNRNRQWIEATNYCNQHDNDGAMIVLVKARKRNTWAPHDTSDTSAPLGVAPQIRCAGWTHRRFGWACPSHPEWQRAASRKNSRPPSTVDTALWPRWIHPMAGMTSNSVRWILVCLLPVALSCLFVLL